MLTECIFCKFYITFVVQTLIRHHAMKKQHSFWICCLERHEGSDSHCRYFTPRKEPPVYDGLQFKCVYGGKKRTLSLSRIKTWLCGYSAHNYLYIGWATLVPKIWYVNWVCLIFVKCSYYTDVLYSYFMKK